MRSASYGESNIIANGSMSFVISPPIAGSGPIVGTVGTIPTGSSWPPRAGAGSSRMATSSQGLGHHARLNRELSAAEARLQALATPAPDVHGDEADQRTALQNVEDVVTERARLEAHRRLLLSALVKIDRGDFGICELSWAVARRAEQSLHRGWPMRTQGRGEHELLRIHGPRYGLVPRSRGLCAGPVGDVPR